MLFDVIRTLLVRHVSVGMLTGATFSSDMIAWKTKPNSHQFELRYKNRQLNVHVFPMNQLSNRVSQYVEISRDRVIPLEHRWGSEGFVVSEAYFSHPGVG